MVSGDILKGIVSGALVVMYLIAALFFLRFRRRSKEALFAYLAAAFLILAGQQLALTITRSGSEYNAWSYFVRLLAYVVILAGIWNKNRATARK